MYIADHDDDYDLITRLYISTNPLGTISKRIMIISPCTSHYLI